MQDEWMKRQFCGGQPTLQSMGVKEICCVQKKTCCIISYSICKSALIFMISLWLDKIRI